MSNGKTVITHSLILLMKNIYLFYINIHYRKRVAIFSNRVNILLEIQ